VKDVGGKLTLSQGVMISLRLRITMTFSRRMRANVHPNNKPVIGGMRKRRLIEGLSVGNKEVRRVSKKKVTAEKVLADLSKQFQDLVNLMVGLSERVEKLEKKANYPMVSITYDGDKVKHVGWVTR